MGELPAARAGGRQGQVRQVDTADHENEADRHDEHEQLLRGAEQDLVAQRKQRDRRPVGVEPRVRGCFPPSHAVEVGLRLLPGSSHVPWVQRRLRSEEHTSELQSQSNLVCRLLLEKKKNDSQASTYPSPYHMDSGATRFKTSTSWRSNCCH